jgi:hypothetical protein
MTTPFNDMSDKELLFYCRLFEAVNKCGGVGATAVTSMRDKTFSEVVGFLAPNGIVMIHETDIKQP